MNVKTYLDQNKPTTINPFHTWYHPNRSISFMGKAIISIMVHTDNGLADLNCDDSTFYNRDINNTFLD